MSLNDPIHPNDEQEAIEAEFMLHAERDAREHMDGASISVSYYKRSWMAILRFENDTVIRGMSDLLPTRSEAIGAATVMWDNEHARITKEIYEREYKNNV